MKFNVFSPEPVSETIVGVQFVEGKALDVDSAVDSHRRALEYFRKQGYRVERAGGTDAEEETAAEHAQFERGVEPQFGPGTPGGPIAPDTTDTPGADRPDVELNPPVDPPSPSASKTIWLDYIVSDKAGDKRLDQVDADPMTRNQLAEHVYGRQEA